MLGGGDVVPRVAGDEPPFRRLALERVEVLGLAGEEAHHQAALEQPAELALAHELREVAPEGHVVDRLGLGRGEGLHLRARVDLE